MPKKEFGSYRSSLVLFSLSQAADSITDEHQEAEFPHALKDTGMFLGMSRLPCGWRACCDGRSQAASLM
jgi:hypothetical protein